MTVYSLSDLLQSGKFVITTELNPPKGTELAPLLERAESLRGVVDAFNLTDSHTARMSMSPIAAAHLLQDRGLEPIMQLTCRDRNRIALQADVLAAAALGIRNIVTMTGDHPGGGDHPDAKPVFDIDSTALLKSLTGLRAGSDMSGAELRGSPELFVGRGGESGRNGSRSGNWAHGGEDRGRGGRSFRRRQCMTRASSSGSCGVWRATACRYLRAALC